MGKVSKAIGVTSAVVGISAVGEVQMLREKSVVRDTTTSIIHQAEDALTKWRFKPGTPEPAKAPESSRPMRPPPEIRPTASLPLPPSSNDHFRPITLAAASDGISTIYGQATPAITKRLYDYGNALTREDIAAVMQDELRQAAEAAKPADEPWFTILSGNVKIPKLQKLAGGKVAVGTINIYAPIAFAAPVAYACKGRPYEEFAKCVGVVVKKMASDALEKLEASAPPLETKDGKK